VLRDAGPEEDLDSLEEVDDDPEDRADLARLGLDDEEDLPEEDDEEEDADEEEGDEAEVAQASDEEDADESSLEQLLDQRAAARRGSDDSDEESEILALSSEPDTITIDVDPPPGKVTPIRSDEFVCTRCYLVKPRVQRADAERGLCRDCV
jgi:hypothetical protein